ncbi:hypothetical protein HY086_02685 [Candidatus Gottesmanbacteria bacterium]|nr:hypothetical protein [Candidatus Gottesmanbacteria bacterium]
MQKSARKFRKLGNAIVGLADTTFGTAVDTTLFLLFACLATSTVKTTYDSFRVVEEVDALRNRFNYASIKRAIYGLTHQKLISRSPSRSSLDIAITDLGKKRLASIIPTYQTKRPWDGFVYLISYDIPTKLNHARDLLREHIKTTGGVKLQESLWINPYNPSLLLEEFANLHNIPGTILVSKLGHDGAIGEEELTDVIVRVYELNKLTERYNEFIATYKDTPKVKSTALLYDYLTVLKDDPQLPFALLPKNFPADTAYRLAKPFLDKLNFTR